MDDRAVDQAIGRPARYWYEDGIAEIVTGLVFLLIGVLFWLESTRHCGRRASPPSA